MLFIIVWAAGVVLSGLLVLILNMIKYDESFPGKPGTYRKIRISQGNNKSKLITHEEWLETMTGCISRLP